MPAHIISASRRTDIPAFYTPWLMQRIRAGFVMVRNPRNVAHVMRVSLAAPDVVAVLFWSRDYGRLIPLLGELDDRGLRPCFQFTLTGYDRRFEARVPTVAQARLQFEQLCARYGRRRVIWRYDPIVFGNEHSADWHMMQFRRLAEQLAPWVSDAVISLLDLYPSARRGLDQLTEATGERFMVPPLAQRVLLAGELAAIGAELGIRVRACCEPELVAAGVIEAARCIDPQLMREVVGCKDLELKDAPTRKGCGCVAARDIGAYQSCAHGCVYCYANDSPEASLRHVGIVQIDANHLGSGDLQEQRPVRRNQSQQLGLPGLDAEHDKASR